MFLHLSVFLFTVWTWVAEGGVMRDTGGACMARGHARQGGMCGKRGVHGRGYVCWRSMHSRGHVWWMGVACVAGEMATAAVGTHPTGMHSCFSFEISKDTIFPCETVSKHQTNFKFSLLKQLVNRTSICLQVPLGN